MSNYNDLTIGLMFIAYNLKRVFNIVDRNELKEYFKRVISYILTIICIVIEEISYFKTSIYLNKLRVISIQKSLNQLMFGQ